MTTGRFSSAALPLCVLLNQTKTIVISTKMCALRTAFNTATCLQFVDFTYTADVARVNAAALAMLALAPARPKNVGVVTARLTNDTDLKWDANKEADLAGYEIVWRDTTAPVWTNSKWVGNVNSYTVAGMSKDNFFFGVRAVDKQGNRSPVSFPRPVR